MKITFSQIIAVGLMVGTMGCSKGGFTTNLNSSGSDKNNGQGGASIPSSIDVGGTISSGDNAGLKAIDIDRAKQLLILTVPLGQNPFIMLSNGQIPQYPGTTYSTIIDTNGKAYLILNLPLKYVLHGVNGIDPLKLPNGDPLPGMPSGELPGIGLSIDTKNNVKLYVYIGVDAVGVFVESPFDIGIPNFPLPNLTVPIKNTAKTAVVGYFSLVFPKQNNTVPGGMFLAFQLPAEISALLDKYVL